MGTISLRKADGPLVYADIPVCRRIELVDERNIGWGIVCPRSQSSPAFLNSSAAELSSISALGRRRINQSARL